MRDAGQSQSAAWSPKDAAESGIVERTGLAYLEAIRDVFGPR
jgi:hypothetical protein